MNLSFRGLSVCFFMFLQPNEQKYEFTADITNGSGKYPCFFIGIPA